MILYPMRYNYAKYCIFIPDKVYLYKYCKHVTTHIHKRKRKLLNLTQQDLADKAGVGIRFIRDLEQGKLTLRMDKVNQVLNLFGQELGPVSLNKNS